jgi:hypothetical protein
VLRKYLPSYLFVTPDCFQYLLVVMSALSHTTSSQMLSAYARRGLGMTILRNTLAEPLQKICAQRSLNLEINPLKVYQEYVADVETRTGQRCDLPACESAEQAALLPVVAEICARRLVQLLDCCRTLLTRIIDGVESIPYVVALALDSCIFCLRLSSLCPFRKRFVICVITRWHYRVTHVYRACLYLNFSNFVIFISPIPDTVCVGLRGSCRAWAAQDSPRPTGTASARWSAGTFICDISTR